MVFPWSTNRRAVFIAILIANVLRSPFDTRLLCLSFLVLYSASVLRYVRRHLTFILSRLFFWISCAFCLYYYVMFPFA